MDPHAWNWAGICSAGWVRREPRSSEGAEIGTWREGLGCGLGMAPLWKARHGLGVPGAFGGTIPRGKRIQRKL